VAALERAIHDELANAAAKPPDARELRKAKNLLLADYVRGLKTVSGKANQIGFYEAVFGDYATMFDQVRLWEAVTADDVQRVARTYLVETNRTTIELKPERPPPGAPPPADAAPPGAGTGGVQ
jgi:zinc protease